MNDDQEVDLQEEVRAAFVAYDDDGTDSDAGAPRGADGKFIEHELSDEVAAAAKLQPEELGQQTEEPVPQILTEDKAPRGWTPAAREKWETISPDLRQEILRREDASIAGVRQLQERYAPMEQFIQGISPILQEAQYYGVDPGGYIDQVMGTERTLRNADIPGKFQAILAIADQYGVPLRDVINQSVGQQVIPPVQQPQYQVPPQIMQELNEMRQWRNSQQSSMVNAQIQEFSADKEFFHDVHMQMATFIDSGQANSLQEAYDAACWSVPAVREVMLARQGLQKKQESAAGASVRPGGGVVVPGDEESDELEDVVRSAFIKSSTGRV
jgi:hypothetical protein